MEISTLIVGIIAIVVGVGFGYYIRQTIAKNQVKTAEGKTNKMIDEAKVKSQEMTLEAKKKSVDILEKAKEEERSREKKVEEGENRLAHREEIVDKRMEEIDRGRGALEKKAKEIQGARKEVEDLRTEEMVRIEKISNLTQDQAKKALLQLVEEESKDDLAKQHEKLLKRNSEDLEKEARNIMTQVIQKYSRSHAAEVTTSTLAIPSDEVKGKIIGKEGRNIRALERYTGVVIVVDDTPDSVILSSFDPIRREVAKITLEKLIDDGRIHPTRIEESVKEAEKEIDGRVREAGEAAAYEVGIAGLNPKLLYILGRLRYRTSFKQNVLLHSLEVSYLASTLAAELGCDVKAARLGGLLHDIGKAVDHEVQGTHVEIGIKIMQKFGIDEKAILAMRSHHDEYPYASPEAYLVSAADAISASRPGARRDTVENYIKRLEELETLTGSFDGVEKCYAIQAGREIRVIVKSEEIDDNTAFKLARSIADKIEEELKYPGEIKVNVLRETRAIEYAR